MNPADSQAATLTQQTPCPTDDWEYQDLRLPSDYQDAEESLTRVTVIKYKYP